ncbi:hypothetical protein [Aeromonas veronii]|uniref:hypothetical protein n=1 Tax=Aeromonas veronii TaxID=654 RepID=UPI003D1EBF11
MTTDNKTTVSYTETTTVSTDGKITRKQETKVVGNPTSPEVKELMGKVSDKGSKVGDLLLVAAGAAILGGGVTTAIKFFSKGKKNERVINPDPGMVEEIKLRLNGGGHEYMLALSDQKYTQEEINQAKMEVNAESEAKHERLKARLKQLKRDGADL